ncbi:MAG: Peptidoglycan-binding lysin domain protein, partial [Frankiales bacterium]|nr:Peptidoglycan-binding lysin domain protein [Frankiales bacterium]
AHTAPAVPRLTHPAVAQGRARHDEPVGSDRTVVVRAGDSLWSLAAEDLGPHASSSRVAQEWPRWWAANRSVVGDRPDLIHPGDRLSAPRPLGNDS